MLSQNELDIRLDQYAVLIRDGNEQDFDFAVRFFHATCMSQGVIELNELHKRCIDSAKFYDYLLQIGLVQ
jgi:hypothetical protein